MDGNKDGVVTLSEFLEACRADPDISTSMAALDTAFWHSARPRYMPWTWKHSVDLEIYMYESLNVVPYLLDQRGKNFLEVYHEAKISTRASREVRPPRGVTRVRIFGLEEGKISRKKKKRNDVDFFPRNLFENAICEKGESRLKDPKTTRRFFRGWKNPSLSVVKL